MVPSNGYNQGCPCYFQTPYHFPNFFTWTIFGLKPKFLAPKPNLLAPNPKFLVRKPKFLAQKLKFLAPKLKFLST